MAQSGHDWLGVGGRTAVLIGLTAVATAAGVAAARRGLRVAGEALTVVALGLVALDVVGADHAGWWGELDAPGLALVTGTVVTAAAYTLPSALALVVVGLLRLGRDPGASTGTALTPGLLLATVPSLVWCLDDPVSLRAAWLGAGCLGLVLAGTLARWNAPLVVGAAAGGVLVLRELAPYAAQTPQWVLIGAAGTLLTVVGVTWERRLLELRGAAAYLDRLR